MEDITLPQLKKAVHTVMVKFYGNDMYRQTDLIRKILRKLKCDASAKSQNRVRTQLKNWIMSNCEITKIKNSTDSKKGIKSGDCKKGILKTRVTRSSSTVTVKDSASSETAEKAKKRVDNFQTENICTCREKKFAAEKESVEKTITDVIIEHELIDLTADDDPVHPIKTEIVEDDMNDINDVVQQLGNSLMYQPQLIYLQPFNPYYFNYNNDYSRYDSTNY